MSVYPPGVYRDVSPTPRPERRHGRHTTTSSTVVTDRRITHAGYVEYVTVV